MIGVVGMSTADLDDERAVLEVVELSESEDEDFDYRAVEVRWKSRPCLIDRKEPRFDECPLSTKKQNGGCSSSGV